MLGDFNARPGSPTYAALRAAGFDDAWTRANPDDDAGFTCCHRERLDDPGDTLRTRIDLILTRGAIAATEAFWSATAPCGPALRAVAVRPCGRRRHARAGLISTLVG